MFCHSCRSTPFLLSYRLLHRVLRSLGYVHATPRGRDALNSSFASQLERLGLWHWAAFVLLHAEDAAIRRRSVSELLGRRARMEDEDFADREDFLREQLRVPEEWIAEAKAARLVRDQSLLLLLGFQGLLLFLLGPATSLTLAIVPTT